MDKKAFLEFSENALNNSIIPNLSTFIRIPNTSPLFDKEWDTNNYLLNAATHLYSYASSLQLKEASINLYKDTNHTPLIYIKISSNIPNNKKSILFYGHFDGNIFYLAIEEIGGDIQTVDSNGICQGTAEPYSEITKATVKNELESFGYIFEEISYYVDEVEASEPIEDWDKYLILA